jgi:hypothetical protein
MLDPVELSAKEVWGCFRSNCSNVGDRACVESTYSMDLNNQ